MTRSLADLTDCQLCCFWLSPDGKGTHTSDEPGEGSHGGLAEFVLGDTTRGQRLDDEGYVHVSYGDAFMGRGYNDPTQRQLDYLFDVQQEMRKRPGMASRVEYIGNFITTQQHKVTA